MTALNHLTHVHLEIILPMSISSQTPNLDSPRNIDGSITDLFLETQNKTLWFNALVCFMLIVGIEWYSVRIYKNSNKGVTGVTYHVTIQSCLGPRDGEQTNGKILKPPTHHDKHNSSTQPKQSQPHCLGWAALRFGIARLKIVILATCHHENLFFQCPAVHWNKEYPLLIIALCLLACNMMWLFLFFGTYHDV